MMYISPTLTGYILLLLSPITVITYYNGRRVKKLSRTIKDNLAQMTICLEEKIGNIRTVKWFNQVGQGRAFQLGTTRVPRLQGEEQDALRQRQQTSANSRRFRRRRRSFHESMITVALTESSPFCAVCGSAET